MSIITSIWNRFQVAKHRRYVVSQVKNGMRLGRNVMICPGVKFDPPHSFLTSIGDCCIIAPDVRFLNHDASLFGIAGFAKIGKIEIGENCFIGAGSLLLPGISIGKRSVVGACAVVTHDIPANSVAVGNPAKVIGHVDEYIARNRQKMESGTYPSYKSAEFYPKLWDPAFRAKIMEEMSGGKGFTVGGDGDHSYQFNV